MKISKWRSQFQKFVADRVSIDSWLLSRPESYSQVVGFMPPLRHIDYRREDTTRVVLNATQDFIISQRLPSELAFKDLPLDILEGMYNTLALAFMANYQDIHEDVFALRFNTIEQPIGITEVAEDANDWIVDLKWSLNVSIEVEPETGAIVSPFYPTSINSGVWRDDLKDDTTYGESDPRLRVLDFSIKTLLKTR